MVKKTFYLVLSLIGVIFLSLVVLFLSQRSDIKVTKITDCLSDSKLTVYCEFSKPEDIIVLPDNRHLLISEFGAITPLSPENLPGQISLFDTDLLKKDMKEFLQEPNRKVLILKQHGWVHSYVKRNINLLCLW